MSIKVMSKYETYSLDQLLELVRNGRADISKKAADEIRTRVKPKKQPACPGCDSTVFVHHAGCPKTKG
jgi:hypothetical protein